MSSRSYQDLIAWQKAMDLVTTCYKVTEKFPNSEIYGLTNQLRRSAVSIPANIAEGQGRQSDADFLRFLFIAYGSLTELETPIQIANRLNFCSQPETDKLLEQTAEVGRLLNGLISFQEKQIPEKQPNKVNPQPKSH